jgi:hypothetical protein
MESVTRRCRYVIELLPVTSDLHQAILHEIRRTGGNHDDDHVYEIIDTRTRKSMAWAYYGEARRIADALNRAELEKVL